MQRTQFFFLMGLVAACGGRTDSESKSTGGTGGATSGGTGGATSGGTGGATSGGTGGAATTGGVPGVGGIGVGGTAGSTFDCKTLDSTYVKLVNEAKACNPLINSLQCTVSVTSSLQCTCPTFISVGHEDLEKQMNALRAQWDSLGCDFGIDCSCIFPVGGTCAVDFNPNFGTCNDKF